MPAPAAGGAAARALTRVASSQACNARNPFPGHVFNDVMHELDLYVRCRRAQHGTGRALRHRACVSSRSYGQTIEVDYRGYDVTVENFLRVLTGARPRRTRASLELTWRHALARGAGRHEDWVPRSKRLLSDASSNVLVYMTGHGGDEFLKFQDQARHPSAIPGAISGAIPGASPDVLPS